MTDKRAPAHIIGAGRIQASIWSNEHPTEGVWYSMTFHRHYRDEKGQPHLAASFGRDDLLVIAEVSRRAWEWVMQQKNGKE